jgi:hypothetical protein
MAGLALSKNSLFLSGKVQRFTTVLNVAQLRSWIDEQKRKPGVRMSMSSLFEAMSYSKSYASRLCKEDEYQEYNIEISGRFIAMLLMITGEKFERFFKFVPVNEGHTTHPQDRYHHWHKCVMAGVDTITEPLSTERPRFGCYWPQDEKKSYIVGTNHRHYDDAKLAKTHRGL